jgi:hypothetical protein
MVHYVHAHSCRTLLCKFISMYLAAYRWDSDALGLALYAAQAVQIPFAGRSTGAQNYPEHSCRNTTFTQVHSISDMRSNCNDRSFDSCPHEFRDTPQQPGSANDSGARSNIKNGGICVPVTMHQTASDRARYVVEGGFPARKRSSV